MLTVPALRQASRCSALRFKNDAMANKVQRGLLWLPAASDPGLDRFWSR